jgi:hypothetical protein
VCVRVRVCACVRACVRAFRLSHLDHIVIVHVQLRTWNFAKHTSKSFGRLRLLMGQSLGPGISEGVNKPQRRTFFMPAVATTSGRLHCELVRVVFLQAHRETEKSKKTLSSLQLQELSMRTTTRTCSGSAALLSTPSSNLMFAISSRRPVLRINLNIDGASMPSYTYTHPSHSQTSRLLSPSSPWVSHSPHTARSFRPPSSTLTLSLPKGEEVKKKGGGEKKRRE